MTSFLRSLPDATMFDKHLFITVQSIYIYKIAVFDNV